MYNVFGFYKFKKLQSLKKKKYFLQKYLIKQNIRGTIILAKEGVNATIAGKYEDIRFFINRIKKALDIKNFDTRDHDFQSRYQKNHDFQNRDIGDDIRDISRFRRKIAGSHRHLAIKS